MKLIYKGKFNGDPETLPKREHLPGAVQFREADSMKALSIIMNVLSLVITVAALAGMIFRLHLTSWEQVDAVMPNLCIGFALAVVSLVPHELLHAVCFREEVELYTNLKQGMLFVTGSETMSKGRFVFMSLLPNLVFGLIPFLLFLLVPAWTVLGGLGALAIGAGAGDYYNVFNALTQMPRGARVYAYGLHSYWYLPEEGTANG